MTQKPTSETPFSPNQPSPPLSALEKLSFTHKENFKIRWQTQFYELVEESKLSLPTTLMSKLIHSFDNYDEAKGLELETLSHTSSTLFISTSLELYSWKNTGSTKSLVPLSAANINQVDDSVFSASDWILIQLLTPFLEVEKNTNYLKLVADPLILDILLKELSVREKLIFISQPSSQTPQESSFKIIQQDPLPLQFRLLIEKNDALKDGFKGWRIWAEFFSEERNFSVDLWQLRFCLQSILLTQQNVLYSIQSSRTALHTLARFLLQQGSFLIPHLELSLFLKQVFNELGFCTYKTPPYLDLRFTPMAPQSILYLKTSHTQFNIQSFVQGQIWFRYDKIEIPALCHRSDKRLSVLFSHQQQDTNLNNESNEIIEFFIPDENKEQAFLDQFQALKNIHFDSKKQAYELNFISIHENTSALLEKGWEVWAENLKIKLLDQFKFQIQSVFQGKFLINLQDSVTKFKIENWQLIHILKKKSAFIQLDDGTLGVLPQVWIQELYRLYQNLNDENFDGITSPLHWMDLDENSSLFSSADLDTQSLLNNIREQFAQAQLRSLEPSLDFKGSLLGYQKQGLAWLVFLDQYGLGGLLADEMGLGKSIQVLAFLDLIKHSSSTGPTLNSTQGQTTLLIAPKSLLIQWKESAKKFTPNLKVKILKPKDILNVSEMESSTSKKSDHEFDILITSYGVLWRYKSLLKKYSFERLVLDEAQLIKNEKTKVSLAAKSLTIPKRLALSGTPIENHAGEFFSLFDFLNPKLLSYRLLSNGSEEDLKKAFQKIKPLVLRRKKDDVLTNLPSKIEKMLFLPLKKEQQEIYNSIKDHYSSKLKTVAETNEFENHKLFFLEGLLRLRQICCHPQIVFSPEETNTTLNSSKLEYLFNEFQLLSQKDHKVIVFSQFTSFLKIIKSKLEENSISFLYLDGQTEERDVLVNEFQTNSVIKIFLMSLKAGGLGLNLTAADQCFIVDPWWNPATENQAIDRLHRIGQLRDVTVYRLISEATIEEKILELHQIKALQAQYLNSSDKDFLESLSAEDFKNLFS